MVINCRFEGMSAAGAAPVLGFPNDVAAMSQNLVDVDAGPCVPDWQRNAGPPIYIHNHGILFSGFETSRFNQPAVEHRSIGALELPDFRRQNGIAFRQAV